MSVLDLFKVIFKWFIINTHASIVKTPGCREETSSPAMRMRSIYVYKMINMSITKPRPMQHLLVTIWPQLNNFQRKMGIGFHKSVRHCKSLRCWEVEQVPHDLRESSYKIFLKQTFGPSVSGLPPKNLL